VNPAHNSLKALSDCGDICNLRSAVKDICAEFGRVRTLDVLTIRDTDKRRALCFLRLESAAQEGQLIGALDAVRFGEEVLIIVDLAPIPDQLPL